MRLTLDVAQFGGKGVVCHEDGTECGDMCWFCYKRNVQGGTRLTVQTGHTSFLFIILPFTLLTLRSSRRSRDSIDRLIPICPPTIDLLSVPPSMISPFLL